jgi:hypothetical protein
MFGRARGAPAAAGRRPPESLKHAYAAMKLLAQRCGADELRPAAGRAAERRRVPAIAQRLASCADSFLGAALHGWAAIDPACRCARQPLGPHAAVRRQQLQLR